MKQQVIELRNFFSKKSDKRFVLNDTGLIMMNDAKPDQIVDIPVEQIHAFRYGLNWIEGLYFTFGREYFIEIKDEDGYIISIKFSSYYGLRRRDYYDTFQKLIQGVWDFYFVDQTKHFLNLYNLDIAFELNGVTISKSGLAWGKALISWDKLKISSYINYFVVHHIDDHKIQKSFNFKSDWNAFLLQALIINLQPK